MSDRSVHGRPMPPRQAGRRPTGGATVRRTRPVRRASAGLSPVRAGAILVMLLALATVYGVANSSAFAFRHLRLDGATVTDSAAVDEALAIPPGTNLFALQTAPMERALRDLPTVEAASVTVGLPDTLVVHLEEREAILVWRIGERRYLVDPDGHLFALAGDHPPASVERLPVVVDERAASAGLSVGSTLGAVDLDAATRLGSLVPGDVGSQGARLETHVTDGSGFVVIGRPSGWRAVFGFYTASLRTPDLIPGQVRLLRSLLIGREPMVDRVILASETDGTYTTRSSPSPATSGKPSTTPSAEPSAKP